MINEALWCPTRTNRLTNLLIPSNLVVMSPVFKNLARLSLVPSSSGTESPRGFGPHLRGSTLCWGKATLLWRMSDSPPNSQCFRFPVCTGSSSVFASCQRGCLGTERRRGVLVTVSHVSGTRSGVNSTSIWEGQEVTTALITCDTGSASRRHH